MVIKFFDDYSLMVSENKQKSISKKQLKILTSKRMP